VDVTLLEARDGPSRESRSLALSHGSREILNAAGVWSATLGATEIHRIHTSQRGGFGRMVLSREDAGVPALGYVLSYAQIQEALDAQLASQTIAVLRGATVASFDEQPESIGVQYSCDGKLHSLQADAVVLADGGANLDKVGALSVVEKDYAQSALLAHIESDAGHHGTAYERFTPEGPAALLPHGGERQYSLVWVSSPARIELLKTLSDRDFMVAFTEHFGRRAGNFVKVGPRRSFPLKLRTVSARVAGRLVVIGNAAQALHPVAGQGFNLGLRDANELASRLASAGTATALKTFETGRARDVERSVGFTDFLVGAFSNDHLLARLPRGLGLAAMDMLPFARKALAKRMLFGAAK
jgi:2-octaprenyl-6-methoxyphenol hydroxylase